MRLIAFITAGTQIRKILDLIGVDTEPPHIAPARRPPLWQDCDAQMDDGAPGALEITLLGWDFLVVNLAGSALFVVGRGRVYVD